MKFFILGRRLARDISRRKIADCQFLWFYDIKRVCVYDYLSIKRVLCVSIASKNALFLLLLLLYGILLKKEWRYRKVYVSGCWKVLYCRRIKLMEVNSGSRKCDIELLRIRKWK